MSALTILWARTHRVLLCRRGWHSFPRISASTVAGDPTQALNSTWHQSVSVANGSLFTRHCQHCGKYEELTGGLALSLNGWPGNQGTGARTATSGTQAAEEYRENSERDDKPGKTGANFRNEA